MCDTDSVNLYHTLGLIQQMTNWQVFFFIFPRKQSLTFQSLFSEKKIRKLFQNVVCWIFTQHAEH